MVAVTTAEGSRLADPVTTPGPRRHTFQLLGLGSGVLAGNFTTRPRSSAEPFLFAWLGNFGKFTPEVSLDLALVPEPQRSAIGDHAESSNSRQKQRIARPKQNAGDLRMRDLLQNGGIGGGEEQGCCQQHEPDSR